MIALAPRTSHFACSSCQRPCAAPSRLNLWLCILAAPVSLARSLLAGAADGSFGLSGTKTRSLAKPSHSRKSSRSSAVDIQSTKT